MAAVKEITCGIMDWDHKMEKKQKHRGAAKEVVTYQTWCETLSCQMAQSASKVQGYGFC